MNEQKPLANIAAEISVLGSLLFDARNHDGKTKKLVEIAGIVDIEDFYRETHRIVLRAMQALQQNGTPIDLVSLTDYLRRRGEFDKIGGLPFLTQIDNSEPTAANIKHYAEIVRDYARRRALSEMTGVINQMAYDESTDIVESISNVQQALAKTLAHDSRANMHPMQQVMLEYMDLLTARANGERLGIATGFRQYDNKVGRLQGGTLHIIAARPAMGKSALALSIAANVCRQGYSVLYFSLEMPRLQLIDRLIAQKAKINLKTLKNIKTGGEMPAVWNRIMSVIDSLSKYRLEIDDRGNLTYSEIASKAAAMHAGGELDLIIIDHLQIMGTDKSKRYSNRANELDTLTGQLKDLATRLDVPIIALSQLNRMTENRDDKRPTLSDLRDSGGIEQNADTVAGLYRESYYTHDNDDERAELIVLKSRDGEIGKTYLEWHGAYTKFVEGTKPPVELSKSQERVANDIVKAGK